MRTKLRPPGIYICNGCICVARALSRPKFTFGVPHYKEVLGGTMPTLIPKPKRMLVALNKWRKFLALKTLFDVLFFLVNICLGIGSFTNVEKRASRENLAQLWS